MRRREMGRLTYLVYGALCWQVGSDTRVDVYCWGGVEEMTPQFREVPNEDAWVDIAGEEVLARVFKERL